MSYIAKHLADWLLTMEAIKKEDIELYEYAIYSILITISPLILILFIGCLFNKLLEGIVLITPFMAIRKYSGGYHAKTSSRCFCSSFLLLTFLLFIADYMSNTFCLGILLSAANIILILNSPIDSENRRLDDIEVKHYNSILKIILLLFDLLVFRSLYICHSFMVYLVLGICLPAGLQLPCIFIQKKDKKDKEISA